MSTFARSRHPKARVALFSALAMIAIQIAAVAPAFAAPPIAAADSAKVSIGKSVTIDVLANDSDPAGEALSITGLSASKLGAKMAIVDGKVSFTPSGKSVGIDTFTYTVQNAISLETAVGTVSVEVAAANAAPTAVADVAAASAGKLAVIDVLANDSDADGDALSISAVGASKVATIAIVDNKINFTAAADFAGETSFEYTASDGALTATALVTVNVAANVAPTAVADTATATAGKLAVIDVLANDSDADGDALSIVGVGASKVATISIVAGKINFTAVADFVGETSFEYTASDGKATATALVTVNVAAANAAPTVVADKATAISGRAVTIDVLANDSDADGDALTLTAVGGTKSGAKIAIVGGKVAYTAAADFVGVDTFTYTATDAKGAEAIGSVSVTVAKAAVAVAKSLAISEDKVGSINALAGIAAPEGSKMALVAVGKAANGVVAMGKEGAISYTPNANFNGKDAFSYTITDGVAETTATISVAIAAVNDKPVLAFKKLALSEDAVASVNVLDKATDVDLDKLSLVAVSKAAIGTVAMTKAGVVTYTPKANANGEDTFTYTVTDGTVEVTKTVAVSVAAVNDAPKLAVKSIAVVEDTPVVTNVLADAIDIDGDTIVLTKAIAAVGEVAMESTGKVTYTPAADFSGDTTLSVTVSDGTEAVAATIDIVVAAVNDAPVAASLSRSVTAGKTITIPLLTYASDVDGTIVSATVLSVAGGSAVINDDLVLTFAPFATFAGQGEVTYEVTDNEGATDTATITFVVAAAAETLPNTGVDTDVLALIGALLLALGLGMNRSASKRINRIANGRRNLAFEASITSMQTT